MTKDTSPFPTLFLSHGAPDMALRDTPTHRFLAGLGKTLPEPKAILVISAHWETDTPMLTASAHPPMIYDFHGFPPELYKLDYPAPGAPELAAQIKALLPDTQLNKERGFDHGTWSPLLLVYPEAKIPVIQLSVQPHKDAAWQYEIGRKLAPLREQGVLILATGNTTHNLREAFRGHTNTPPQVTEFTSWLRDVLAKKDHAQALDWQAAAPHARWNHPSPEHFLPLFVALGAAGPEAEATLLHDSVDLGVLAMDSYSFT